MLKKQVKLQRMCNRYTNLQSTHDTVFCWLWSLHLISPVSRDYKPTSCLFEAFTFFSVLYVLNYMYTYGCTLFSLLTNIRVRCMYMYMYTCMLNTFSLSSESILYERILQILLVIHVSVSLCFVWGNEQTTCFGTRILLWWAKRFWRFISFVCIT